MANRALPVIGLHQFPNVPIRFQFDSFTKPDGTVVHGDINTSLTGDPTAGQFTSAFFPIMTFAPPPGRRRRSRTACGRTGARRSGADAVGGTDVVFAIKRFDLRTPGREWADEVEDITKA